MLNLKIPKLSDEDRNSLEGLFTYDECREVLETFQADKAPGEDGFTAEFFKVLLQRKYTFSNLSRYQNYITQIVVVPNLKSKFQRKVR